MANVILFRPMYNLQGIRTARFRPPMGALLLAACLAKNNYTVKILDSVTEPHWREELKRTIDNTTICVGVSAMTGAQIFEGLIFSKIIKDNFGIPVVWGGLHASMLPEQTLSNDYIDIVVAGEGEDAFLKIVTALKKRGNLRGIHNTQYKENGRIYSNPAGPFIELDNQPFLPKGLIDYEKYIKTIRRCLPGCKRTFELNTDRGCPHSCAFCYNIHINKSTWRGMTASRMVEHVEYLVQTFNLDGINFISDNFFVDKKRVVDFCTALIQKKIKVGWHADLRADYFVKYEDSFISLLKQSGCKMLTFGIESGSENVLRNINKCINVRDAFCVNKRMKKHGLDVAFHFMVGFPGETRKDVLRTYAIMNNLYAQCPKIEFWGSPSIYTPYPGTPLYEDCIKLGYKPPEKLEGWIDFSFDTIHLPFLTPIYRKWLIDSCRKLFWNNAFRGNRFFRWALFRLVWLRTKFIISCKIPERIEDKIIDLENTSLKYLRRLIKIPY